jgi:hypothetical protein
MLFLLIHLNSPLCFSQNLVYSISVIKVVFKSLVTLFKLSDANKVSDVKNPAPI